MSNIVEQREKYEELNSRCKTILHLLREHQELSQASMSDLLGVSKRVIRYNVKILKEEGFIKTVPNLEDMRGVVYSLRD